VPTGLSRTRDTGNGATGSGRDRRNVNRDAALCWMLSLLVYAYLLTTGIPAYAGVIGGDMDNLQCRARAFIRTRMDVRSLIPYNFVGRAM